MDSVLEHLINPMETLKELKRILMPGGVLLLVVPNEDSMENSFKKLCYWLILQPAKYGKIKPFISSYHIQGFTKKTIKYLIKENNLKLLVSKDFGGNYPFWRGYKFGSKDFFINLSLYLIGLISTLKKEQIQLLALLKK